MFHIKFLFVLLGLLLVLSSCNSNEQFITGSGNGDPTNYEDFLHAYILNETVGSVYFDYAGRRNLTVQGNPALASNVIVHSNYGKSLLFDGTGDWLNMTTPYIDSNNYTTVYMMRPNQVEPNFERFAGDNSALGELQSNSNELQMGGRSGLGNFYFNTSKTRYNDTLNTTWFMLTQIAQKGPSGNYITRNFLNDTEGHNATWNTYTLNAEDIFQVGGTPTSSTWSYFQVVLIYNGTLDQANMTALSNALWSGDLDFITGVVSGPSDSCTCTTGTAWTVNASDYCVLTSGCAVPSLNLTGAGNLTINSVLNITTKAKINLTSTQTIYVKNVGVLNI